MRRTTHLRTTVSAAVVGAVAFGFAGVAMAQDAGDQEATTIDDIIVTAQKREQNLQDVPIVVTTISQEALQDAGVRDIKDLQILTPGMSVTSTQSEASTTARIRGVGTVGDNPGLESSVGIVIDGVYRSRNSVGFGDLGELQRIEVLKGPQGTLFGKNTSAGVINILTAAPSFNFGMGGEVTFGNYGAMGISGSVTGPITDQLAFRLYGATRQRDGFYDVDLGDGPRTETDDADQNFWSLRGQMLWLPNDNTSVRFIADYTSRDEYCCVGVQTRVGPTYTFVDLLSTGTGQQPPASGFGAVPFSRTAFANRGTGQAIDDMGLSVEANIDLPEMFGGSTLTSVTSWRNWEGDQGQDVDYTGADIAYRNDNGEYGYSVENLTQEFRLAGATDRLDWLVGFFATKEDIGRNDAWNYGADYTPFLSYLLSAALNGGNPLIPVSPNIIPCFTSPATLGETTAQRATRFQNCLGTGGNALFSAGGIGFGTGPAYADTYSQESTSYALFTNNTFSVTDQFDITVGLRYTMDEKSLDGHQQNVGTNGNACAMALGNQAAIGMVLGANTPTFLARMCLPWSNAYFNNRTISESHDADELSGTIKASYRFNDMAMGYLSYARGYKSFGYNLDRVQAGITPASSLLFPSEMVDSYEAGVKLTLLDRTLLLNATYFNQTFEDFQLNTFLGTAFVVESIPELTSSGIDADFLWFTPVDGLSLSGGVTYADTQYGNFVAADLANPANFPQLSLLSGSRASFAPEWSSSLSVNFDRDISHGMRLGLSLSGKYMSAYNTGSDLLPWKEQGAFTTLNGRISIGSQDDRWTLDIWGQNITDEEYVQVAYNAPLQGNAFQSTLQTGGSHPGTYYNSALDTQTYDAFLGQPRTYGITLRYKY